MPTRISHCLTAAEIARFSSAYLNEGRKQDVWEIVSMEVDKSVVTATIRMRSHYTSPTDPGGFHLTPFSVLEFLSQLIVIFVHLWGEYESKSQEVWMVSSAVTCNRAIRDKNNIRVRMDIASIKRVQGSILIDTHSKIFDDEGSFDASIKGLLS